MAKKDRKQRQEQAAPPAEVRDLPVSPAEPAAPESPISSGLVLLFWAFIAFLLFGTWAVESFTSVSEARLERWLMLPLAAFCVLILFLTRKKKSPDVPKV